MWAVAVVIVGSLFAAVAYQVGMIHTALGH